MPVNMHCMTLFDITQTNVPNRSRPPDDSDPIVWEKQRKTQCNFDTLLQAISLRSQPENITVPTKSKLSKDHPFGSHYSTKNAHVWTFNFTVNHASVFDDGESALGFLYKDCQGIPMILCGDELPTLNNFLDTTIELKNIHFVKYENEQ